MIEKEGIKIYEINDMTIEYKEGKWIKVRDSYLMVDEADMVNTLWWFIKASGYNGKRNVKSMVREWKTHNKFYYWDIFKKNTHDVDLEEEQKWYMRLFYFIFGR